MLKGEAEDVDLVTVRDQLTSHLPSNKTKILSSEIWKIRYPVLEYPEKISSHSLDKTQEVQGKLLGIKAQYLILDTGVINIKKFQGYEVSIQMT